jgi:hypothetical protein
MQRLSLLAFLFFALNVSLSQAQSTSLNAGAGDAKSNSDSATAKSAPPSTNVNNSAFILSKIDGAVVKAFQKAWNISGNGSTDVEGLVLIISNPDGSYGAVSGGRTNEFREFTFTWNPNIIAIVHTHPTGRDPKPHMQDRLVADRFGVPIFTLTLRGMFMYDPVTKQTQKLKDGLDWSEPASWAQTQHLAANK